MIDAPCARAKPSGDPVQAGRPSISSRLIAVVLPMAITWLTASLRADEPSSPNYERDIKPIFSRRCTVCHNATKRGDLDVSGGLALDSFEGILAGTSRRKVIVAGRSAESELLRRLARRTKSDGCRSRTSRCRRSSRSWFVAGSTPARHGGCPSRTADETVLERCSTTTSSTGPLARSRVPDGCHAQARRRSNSPQGGALTVAVRIGPLPAVTSLAFRGDNRLLAVGTYGQVVLWDLQDGRPTTAIQAIPGPVHALSFSRDGRRLAVGAGLPARSGIVRVYSVPDGTLLHDFVGHHDVVFGLAIRPDGAQLASTSFDQTVDFLGPRPGPGERRVQGPYRLRLCGRVYPGRPRPADRGQGPNDQVDQHADLQGRADV